jgi:hypothetical protein
MKRTGLLLALLLLLVLPLPAQQTERPQGRFGQGQGERVGRFGMGQRVAGAITEMKTDGFVLQAVSGKTVTVKVTGDTQFRRDRQPVKLSDFKVGDTVMVAGEPAGEDAWTARLVVDRGAAMARLREGLGKEFIAGEVKAIEGTKLTIQRVDGETQVIEVDENTSFRKQRESITLPDIKVGDGVFGRGQIKNGVFVASTLNVGDAQRMRRIGPGMMGPGGPPPKP